MKRIYMLIAIAGINVLIADLFAQESEKASPASGTPNPVLPGSPAARPEWARMDIDFEGGSPQKLLEALRGASGKMPNVIIHPDAAKVRIPPFKLHDVSAAQVFTALNTLNDQPAINGYWRQAPLPDGEIWTLVMPHNNAPSAFQPPGTALPSPKNIKVLNLTMALQEYSVDDITTAMEGAWELLDSPQTPTLKFHKDTKLLIIVGDDRQISVANDVLRELMINGELKRRAQNQPKEKEEAKKP